MKIYKLTGIGAGFIPAVLDQSLLDEVLGVSSYEAIVMARSLAVDEGM